MEEEKGTIRLACSTKALSTALFSQNKTGASANFMLLRESYKEIFGDILKKFKDGEPLCNQVCVIGSAGIGKSTFRYFVLRKWLRNEIDIPFKNVLINFGEAYFLVSKDTGGKVEVKSVLSTWDDMDTLALLDPCSKLNGKAPFSALLIVTTSASPLTEQTCTLSERLKLCSSCVMRVWTLDELKLIKPEIEDELLRKFSFVEDGITYCVPRWFFYTNKQLRHQLNDCISQVKRESLHSWFISNPLDRVMDHRLPFRLCVIRTSENSRWEAYRFLSDWICEFVLMHVVAHSSLQRSQFLNMINNPFARGLIGTMFENWAFASLTCEGASLMIKAPSMEIRFSGAGQLNARTGHLPLQQKLLYRAATCFSSIDGCGLVGKNLVLLQMTVSPTHSNAEWNHVKHLVSSAVKLKATSALMVYLVPKDSAFTLPSCESLHNQRIPFTICRGEISGDGFYNYIAAKFQIRVQDAVESASDVGVDSAGSNGRPGRCRLRAVR